MGDNKISEAFEAWAAGRDLTPAPWGVSKYSSPHVDNDWDTWRDAWEAARYHLQGEAVPVVQFRHRGSFDWYDVEATNQHVIDDPDFIKRTLYTHPQPAELNEVSGNSGELPPLPSPARESVSECGPDYFDASQMRQYARAALAATGKQQVGEVHPDDLAVDAFADAMKQKMASARAKGRGGWEDPAQCSAVDLTRLLRDHVEKGDPRDVANFCMMLHQRGESIVAYLDLPYMSEDEVQQVGEVQGDARAQFEASYRNLDLTRDGQGYSASDTNYTWNVWQAALASRQPVGLSPIATRKLEELAAQGYVTNGVAIFNPETGKRGLVDNLGYVGWQGAQGVDLGQFIALAKFGEEFAFSAEKQPHSRVVYAQASRLLALLNGRDAGTGVGNIQPPRDLRTQVRHGNKDFNNG